MYFYAYMCTDECAIIWVYTVLLTIEWADASK